MAPLTAPARTPIPAPRTPGTALLTAGAAAFAVALGAYLAYMAIHPDHWTLYPVDLKVYRSGGLIVRQVRPLYNPHRAAPLYDWPGHGLKFTYPPFAAVVFAVVSCIPWPVLPRLSVAANIALLIAGLWFTVGALGHRRARVRLGATLLAAAAVLWTEPVIRTLYLGQVNLALMALIIWDLSQPGTGRWWKGAGTGIAAGVKLVPLIFIPYLVLTGRFRQAAMAGAGFAATVVAGAVILPADSRAWWLDGLFLRGSRTGFAGWEGNQSLRGLTTRLAGSVAAGKPAWLIAAVLVGVIGLVCAAILHRAGHAMAGLAACALTGLLCSPVSWDHHWVWVAPGAVVAAHYAVCAARTSPPHRWRAAGYAALAAGMCALYGAWPGSLWGERRDLGPFSLGLIWAPPNTDPSTYYRLGDRPWFAEYHWHGIQLITGNAYLLAGLVLTGIVVTAATRTVAGRRRAACPLPASPQGPLPASPQGPLPASPQGPLPASPQGPLPGGL